MLIRKGHSLSYRNFEDNIARAIALARFDGYLQDLIENEGRNTIGGLVEIPSIVLKTTGMDGVIDEWMKDLQRRAEIHFKENFSDLGEKKELEAEIMKRIKPLIGKIVKIITDVGLVLDQTLPEQALVLAVSAFEVYIHDFTVAVVSRNKKLRARFFGEMRGKLTPQILEEYGQDSIRAQAEIVADTLRMELRSLNKHISKLGGPQNIFVERETERRYTAILERRHVIVHKAGIIDPKFKRITKHRGSIDKPLVTSRSYVLRSIKLLQRMVDLIDAVR